MFAYIMVQQIGVLPALFVMGFMVGGIKLHDYIEKVRGRRNWARLVAEHGPDFAKPGPMFESGVKEYYK